MNTRSHCMVVLFLACLLGAPVLLLSQSASALFEQGLLKENAEGTPDEAIVIFSRIAEDKAVDPAIRARAQLHVGMCYEKLGRREARAAYQKVIDGYPQQHQEVALAREDGQARRRFEGRCKQTDVQEDPLSQQDQLGRPAFP